MYSVAQNQHPTQTHSTGADPVPQHPLSVTHVDTESAAKMLGFKVATLQKWHSTGQGPIKPTLVARRLKWAVADIQAVLSGSK